MFSERRDAHLQIDISPLIDVVFLLLIFFMVTTTFSEQQTVDIELPSASGEAQGVDRDRPEVVGDRNGVVRLDGEVVPVEALAERLRARMEGLEGDDRIVSLRLDGAASWELGLQVMSQLRDADAAVASALTQPRPNEGDREEEDVP